MKQYKKTKRHYKYWNLLGSDGIIRRMGFGWKNVDWFEATGYSK